ncbi:MAG TPA: hypothetical protein VFF31_00205 [Blastocatellia bacterium]|nr:hypothetical protein [Blastocatellia bacterium]
MWLFISKERENILALVSSIEILQHSQGFTPETSPCMMLVLVVTVVNHRIQDMALLTEGGSRSGSASINMALLTEGGSRPGSASINIALLTEGGSRPAGWAGVASGRLAVPTFRVGGVGRRQL